MSPSNYDICRLAKETHVYKVMHVNTLYVFAGEGINDDVARKIQDKEELNNSEHQALQDTYGHNYKNKLGIGSALRVRILRHTLYRDDNIAIVKRKIQHYLFPKSDVYLWIKREVQASDAFILGLVTHIFKGAASIRAEDLAHALNYLTNKTAATSSSLNGLTEVDGTQAYELIKKMKLGFVYHPLEFKRYDNGYNAIGPVDPTVLSAPFEAYDVMEVSRDSGVLLEHYKIKDNVLYVALPEDVHADVRKQFFLQDAAVIDTSVIDTVDHVCNKYYQETISMDARQHLVECSIGYLHLRCNENVIPVGITLFELFRRLHLNKQMVFAKYNSGTANGSKYYKLFKPDLHNLDIEDIHQWIETTQNNNQSHQNQKEYVVIKSRFSSDAKTFSLIVFSDFHIDIKFSIKKRDLLTFSAVAEHGIPAINNVINYIRSIAPELRGLSNVEKYFWLQKETNVKIVNMVTHMRIESKDKDPGIESVKGFAETLFPYINVDAYGTGGDKRTLLMSYKRVDNYANVSNIARFLNKSSSQGLEDGILLERLQVTFNLTREAAKAELEKWKQVSRPIAAGRVGGSYYLKFKDAHGVAIKLKKAAVGYVAIIEGITSLIYHTRIATMLRYILLNAGAARRKQKETDKAKYDNLAFEDDNSDVIGFKMDDFDNLEDDDLTNDGSGVEDEFGLDDIDFDIFIEDNDDNKAGKDNEDNKDNEDQDKKHKMRERNDEDDPDAIDNLIKIRENNDTNRYVLNKLRRADKELFKSDYSKRCQHVVKRQPIVITESEKANIDAKFPGSYKTSMAYRTNDITGEKNIYICPDVWCPLSKVSMTWDQFVQSGRHCPALIGDDDGVYEPHIDLRDVDDKGVPKPKQPRFIGFMGKNLECLPCCFTKEPKGNNNNHAKINMCLATDTSAATQRKMPHAAEASNTPLADINSSKYILGPQYPLEAGRLGVLPKPVADLFAGMQCGSGAKGTGFINENTNCFVRLGVSNASTRDYFLTCLEYVFNKPNVLDLIYDNLPVETFLVVNDGRLASMFIDTRRSVYDVGELNSFKKWFVQQNMYVSTFNLYPLRNALLALGNTDDFSKLASLLKEHKVSFKELLREYLIFGSYSKFKAFLKDSTLPKKDDVLLDIVNVQSKWLNPRGINIMIIECDSEDAYVVCSKVHVDKPIVILVKQGSCYEPLVHIKQNIQNMKVKFSIGQHPDIDSIIKSHQASCASVALKKGDARVIKSYLAAMKLKIRYQVLDYDYKLIGFIMQKGFFFPVRKQTPILERNAMFIYANDICKYIKDTPKSELDQLLLHIHELTSDTMYKVVKVVEDDDQEIVALINDAGSAIPIKKSACSMDTYLDHLNVFIDWQESDSRKRFVDSISQREQLFEIVKAEVIAAFQHDAKLSPGDLQTKDWQKVSMEVARLLQRIVYVDDTSVTGKNIFARCSGLKKRLCHGHCEWVDGRCKVRVPQSVMDLFKGRLTDILVNSNKKRSTGTSSIISGEVHDEIVFGQREVSEGSALKMIQAYRNPYGFLDTVIDAYIDENVLVKSHGILSDQWTRLPFRFKEYMKGFCVNVHDSTPKTHLFAIFTAVAHFKGIKVRIDDMVLRKLMDNDVISSIQQHGVKEVSAAMAHYNPSFEFLIRTRGAKGLSANDVITALHDEQYWPSEYEIMLLANLIDVNVVVLARQTKRNPNGLKLIKPHHKSQDFVFLHQTTSKTKTSQFDTYQVVSQPDRGENFLFSEKDIPGAISKIKELAQQLTLIEIS